MQHPPPNALNSSLSNGMGRRMSSELSKDENIVTIAQDAGPQFRVLVVDRDCMSGDLLANALVRDQSGGSHALSIWKQDRSCNHWCRTKLNFREWIRFGAPGVPRLSKYCYCHSSGEHDPQMGHRRVSFGRARRVLEATVCD
jgi:hypothetical protein